MPLFIMQKHFEHLPSVMTINGGISELLSRVRKVMSARINGRLATPLNVGLNTEKSHSEIFKQKQSEFLSKRY